MTAADERPVDVGALWDFDDPAGSEERLRAAAAAATGVERLIWLTQVARALGLQEQYAAAYALLDEVDEAGALSAELATLFSSEVGC